MLVTSGIHHITAIVNDPQRNIDFYTNILGLRLVKKTVNFERPEVYHLYFGNERGDPGTVITFFPWPKLRKGRIGTKQLGVIVFTIPHGSYAFWKGRLRKLQIPFKQTERFGEEYLVLKDPDGLTLELVERNVGMHSKISDDYAIQGFAGAVLYSTHPNQTKEILEDLLGMKYEAINENYIRLSTEAGNTIDINIDRPVRGLAGAGTVHHVAWKVKDESELRKWQSILEEKGLEPTEIKDRKYFKSLYFEEPGEIQFELATNVPGFTVDEEVAELGTKLMLPSWLEPKRKELEEKLPPIQ